jgi:CxxC motif-containing protein
MKESHEVVCILCPLGCHVQVKSDHSDNITSVTGNECKLGEKYAVQEHRFPARTLTTTLLTQSSRRKLLPVKSDRPIHKWKLKECMSALSQMNVRPPIKMGQVTVPNIANTGANLIATDELAE